ncbi:carbohydrate esterase family 5 protein [Hypoxylon sp. FL1857]|nr:carbohydrate esterase family 5 protein [Hypoxylon sp. FL1857]
MAHLRYVVLLVPLLALVTAQETGLDTCTDVHIFLSRGNNEPYPGRQGKLVRAICSGLASCDYEDIVFNNALQTEYCGAVESGREAGIEQITAYNKRCPDTKLVVSGYSQGAQVLGDILGGGGGVFFQGCTTPTVPGLDPKSAPGNKIAAALLFGDTRHTTNQPYNTLTGASINGLFPRSGQQLAGLHNFAGVLRDWCQGDDPICASGDGKRIYNVQHHLNYFDVYSSAAAEWVKSKLAEATTLTSSSTTASSMATASETSTRSSTVTATISAISTGTSTLFPEATGNTVSGSGAPPTATSSSQEGGAETVRCSRGHIGLGALVWLIFTAA